MREDWDEEFWEQHSASRPSDPIGLVERFEELLDTNPRELEIQSFLEDNPWLLSEQFPHCGAIIPQFSFGGQYRADFVAPERCSGDTIWYLIELEAPSIKLVTGDGHFSATIRQAVRQINDWKRWLRQNMDVARRSRRIGGLGLHDISELHAGLIIAGRRSQITPRFNELRTDLSNSDAIQIRTYDSILEWARKRAEFWAGYEPLSLPIR